METIPSLRIDKRTLLIFLFFAFIWTFLFPATEFLQDQLTYNIKALETLDHTLYKNDTMFHHREIHIFYELLTAPYPRLIAGIYSLTSDLVTTYRILHFLFVFAGLVSIFLLLRFLRFPPAASILTAMISIVPRYTIYDWYGTGGIDTVLPRAFGAIGAPLLLIYFLKFSKSYKVLWLFAILIPLLFLHLSFIYIVEILILAAVITQASRHDLKKCAVIAITGLGLFLILKWAILYETSHHTAGSLRNAIEAYYHIPYAAFERVVSGTAYLHDEIGRFYVWNTHLPGALGIAFLLFNMLPVLSVALWGHLSRDDAKEPPQLSLFPNLIIAAILSAFAIPVLAHLYYLWRHENINTFEQLRALRYLYLFLYVYVALLLSRLIEKKRFVIVTLVTGALLIPPLSLIERSPEILKKKAREFISAQRMADNYRDNYNIGKYLSSREERRLRQAQYAAIIDMGRWLRKNTDKDSVVITDIDEIKLYAERTTKYSIIDGATGVDWYHYWYYYWKELTGAYRSRDTKRLIGIAKELGGDYLILPAEIPADTIGPVVYQNSYYKACKIR